MVTQKKKTKIKVKVNKQPRRELGIWGYGNSEIRKAFKIQRNRD